MAGLTGDILVWEYGVGVGAEPVAYGVGATQQLYAGAVALISGSGATSVGYLKNAAVAGQSDLVAGIVGEPSGGTYVKTGAGILGGSTDGAVWADVRTGAYFIQSGSGADLLTASNNGKTVWYGGENSSGPIACATNTGGRPVLGIQLPQDPGILNGFAPGANYWPIKLNVIGGP